MHLPKNPGKNLECEVGGPFQAISGGDKLFKTI